MKKKMVLAMILLLTCGLVGCASNEAIQQYYEEQIVQKSGIQESEDYKNYEVLLQSGQIDSDGVLGEATEEEATEEVPDGQIHVTFADNANLQITYFKDSELTEMINTSNCFINPGDAIYASIPKVVSDYNDVYQFQEFRVLEYDQDGNPGKQISTPSGNVNLVIKLQKNYAGKELSVMALGQYLDLKFSFTLCSDDGALNEGQWSVDGQNCTGRTASVNPFASHAVRCDYSPYIENYYFEDATPGYVETSHMDEIGIVAFKDTTDQKNTNDYMVKLHEYVKVTVTNKEFGGIAGGVNGALSDLTKSSDAIKSFSISGESQEIKNVEKQEFSKLKCGETMVLRVGADYKASVSGLVMGEPTKVNDGYEYAITIPQTTETELSITVFKRTATLGGYEQKNVSDAVLTVSHEDGMLLSAGEEVDDTANVTVIITPAEGYYISGDKISDNKYQETMQYKRYMSEIDKIVKNHSIQKYITVTLPCDDEQGSIAYKTNGKEVSGQVQLKDGQVLSMEYTLTALEYEIVRDSNPIGFFTDVFSKTKEVTNITIDTSMDGQTINRENYITVEKA